MTYESLRALVVATMRHAIENTDGAAAAERNTDAGTKVDFPDTVIEPDPDYIRDQKYETGEWE